MEMKVKQCMSKPAVVCHLDDTLHEAAKRMWENDCGALPVITTEGHVAAMLTDRDICMAAYTQGHPLHALKVSGAMSRTVYACSSDDSVEAAERLMRDHRTDDRPQRIRSRQRHSFGSSSGPSDRAAVRERPDEAGYRNL